MKILIMGLPGSGKTYLAERLQPLLNAAWYNADVVRKMANDWDSVCTNIETGLLKDGYKRGLEYEIMLVPNITNITYGRGVGYVFEEEVFEKSITDISATKIREKMRNDGLINDNK